MPEDRPDPLLALTLALPPDWKPSREALERNRARHAARAKPYQGRPDLEALDRWLR